MKSKSDLLNRPRGILGIALVTYLVWVIATFFLEGRILTLLRPEAVTDRIVYTLIANILIGTLLALFVVRHAINLQMISPASAGFQPFKRTLIAVVIAAILGIIFLILSQPASRDPVILLNVYAQVLTVTIAEIAVCWVMIGSIVEGAFPKKGRIAAIVIGIFVSSLLFGIYHVAHSPPFNQPAMVVFLSVVGVVTGLVYFIGRDVYATMVFHNFFGSVGVLQSLSASGLLDAYSQPLVPVIGMAVMSLLIFLGIDLLYVRRTPTPV